MPMNVMSTLVGIEIAVTRVERTESRKSRMTMHREDEAEQALLVSDVDRLLDEGRLVEHDGDLGVVEPSLASRSETIGVDALRDLDGVRRRELGDGDREGRLAVDARDRGRSGRPCWRRSRRRRWSWGRRVSLPPARRLPVPRRPQRLRRAGLARSAGRARLDERERAMSSTELSCVPVCTDERLVVLGDGAAPGRARRSAAARP